MPFTADMHIYDCLYKGGSSPDGGTLTQLLYMLNRHDIGSDVTGRFNTAVDLTHNRIPEYIKRWPKNRQS